MSCDLCGATGTRTRFCDACGVDYCEDCALGAHDAMHEIAAEAQRVAEEWLR